MNKIIRRYLNNCVVKNYQNMANVHQYVIEISLITYLKYFN